MPYRCIHCEEVYEDGANEVLAGCSKCKSKFFFYIKQEKMKEILENMEVVNLSNIEKDQMEKDVRDITGIKDEAEPVFLDFESVKVLKPGKYLLDLAKLFSMSKPRVYQLEDGKYIVDISPTKTQKIK
jgi:predicted  nucleic acid-binding Zn-ribbon protein